MSSLFPYAKSQQDINGQYPATQIEKKFRYDAAGRVEKQEDLAGEGGTSNFTIYSQSTGLPFRNTDSRIGVFGSDAFTEFDYDSAGNRVWLKDASGNTTRSEFDELSRITKETATVRNPANTSDVDAIREWDHQGLVTEQTDRNGRVIEVTNDPVGRKTTEVWLSATGVEDRLFESLFTRTGELASIREFAGGSDPQTATALSEVFLDYNPLGQVIQERLDAVFNGIQLPSQRIVSDYHELGSVHHQSVYLDLTPGSDPSDESLVSGTTFDIDKLGRVLGILQDVNSSANGFWSSDATPTDKAIKYKYNSDGTRQNVVRLANLSYDQTVQINQLTVQRGISNFSYLGSGKLESLYHKANDTSNYGIANYGFEYDTVTARISLHSNVYLNGSPPENNSHVLRSEGHNYQYDKIGQMKQEVFTVGNELPENGQSVAYRYDATGNRIGQGDFPGDDPVSNNNISVTGNVARGNRLQEDPSFTYKYDLEGNLIERIRKNPLTTEVAREIFEWDNRNQLLAVDQYVGTTTNFAQRITYDYDGLGRKVARDVVVGVPQTARITEGYVWAGGEVVLDLNLNPGANQGKITNQYLYGPGDGELLAIDVATTLNTTETVWTFADTTGSIESYVVFADNNESLLQHRTFDVFGNENPLGRTNQGSLSSFFNAMPTFWDGNRLDPLTNFYDTGTDWYDPRSGRYLSDQGGLSNFAYRFNNPVRPAPTSDSSAKPLSRETWEKIEGDNPEGVSIGGAIVAGLTDAALFGHGDLVLGEGVSAAHSGSIAYWAALGVGIAGHVMAGNAAASALAAGKAITTVAGVSARAYVGYSIVGDVVGVIDSSRAIANGTFTPFDALGFVPTVGWAMSGYRGLRGVTRTSTSIAYAAPGELESRIFQLRQLGTPEALAEVALLKRRRIDPDTPSTILNPLPTILEQLRMSNTPVARRVAEAVEEGIRQNTLRVIFDKTLKGAGQHEMTDGIGTITLKPGRPLTQMADTLAHETRHHLSRKAGYEYTKHEEFMAWVWGREAISEELRISKPWTDEELWNMINTKEEYKDLELGFPQPFWL